MLIVSIFYLFSGGGMLKKLACILFSLCAFILTASAQQGVVNTLDISKILNYTPPLNDPSIEYIPDIYEDSIAYTVENIPKGSRMLARTYYYDANGHMYTPYPISEIPHDDTQTDNANYLQFDSILLDAVVYQYGLEYQSRQFQEGALFGMHEESLWSNLWYQSGYEDGQSSNLSPNDKDLLGQPYYDSGFEDGRTAESDAQAARDEQFSGLRNGIYIVILLIGSLIGAHYERKKAK